jgi:hypothetical protein
VSVRVVIADGDKKMVVGSTPGRIPIGRKDEISIWQSVHAIIQLFIFLI